MWGRLVIVYMSARDAPQLAVACILGRFYSMTLEATLQATGFEDTNISFINPVDPTEDVVVAHALAPDDRAWAAQHVSAWRQCGASAAPMLIFQDDTAFSSTCSNLLETSNTLVTAVQGGTDLGPTEVMYLGPTAPGNPHLKSQGAAIVAGEFTLTSVRAASTTAAYVLWPAAAAKLLASLPLDVPVAAFMSKHLAALAISPALAIPEEDYQASALSQRSVVQGTYTRYS